MTRDDIIRMAREAGLTFVTEFGVASATPEWLERFAKLIYEVTFRDANIAASRTIIDAAVLHEREACAKVCEEKQEYSMPIPCPDGISGCLVAHYIPARREKTGSECAAAIRARSQL